jgi:hypothetical protein
VLPYANATVPVTLVGKVAVNVTDCPYVLGFSEDASVIVGNTFVIVTVVVPLAKP